MTITVYQGTDQEKDYTIKIPDDNLLWILLHEGNSDYFLYGDRECKESHMSQMEVKGISRFMRRCDL